MSKHQHKKMRKFAQEITQARDESRPWTQLGLTTGDPTAPMGTALLSVKVPVKAVPDPLLTNSACGRHNAPASLTGRERAIVA